MHEDVRYIESIPVKTNNLKIEILRSIIITRSYPGMPSEIWTLNKYPLVGAPVKLHVHKNKPHNDWSQNTL